MSLEKYLLIVKVTGINLDTETIFCNKTNKNSRERLFWMKARSLMKTQF